MRAVVNEYKENCAKVLLSNKACILEMHMTRPNYDSELLFHIDAYVNAIYLYHNYFIIRLFAQQKCACVQAQWDGHDSKMVTVSDIRSVALYSGPWSSHSQEWWITCWGSIHAPYI